MTVSRLFVIRHVLLALAYVVSVVILGFIAGFSTWTNVREGIEATYYTDGIPYGFQVYYFVAPTITLILLSVLFIFERVVRHSMLSVPSEAIYVGLNWAMWLGGAIYGQIDYSPFTEPYSTLTTDRCHGARGNMKMWCQIYQATNVFAFIEMAALFAWLCIVISMGPLDSFWARPASKKAAAEAATDAPPEGALTDTRSDHQSKESA